MHSTMYSTVYSVQRTVQCTCIVPFCVFRFILQPRKQTQDQTVEGGEEVLPERKIVLLIDIQQGWPYRHRGTTDQRKQATAIYKQV